MTTDFEVRPGAQRRVTSHAESEGGRFGVARDCHLLRLVLGSIFRGGAKTEGYFAKRQPSVASVLAANTPTGRTA